MDIEVLKYTLDHSIELVRNTDNKNGIMVAVAAGLVALLFSSGEFLTAVSLSIEQKIVLYCFLLGLALIALVVFLVALFASILPVDKCSERSLIYAGSISKYKTASEYKNALVDCTYDLTDDLVQQIFINSKIFKKKSTCNKIASWSLYILILLIVLFVLCFMIGIR